MNPDNALILITHYQRLLDYIRPDFIHVMMMEPNCQSGGPELALKLEEKGYDWLTPQCINCYEDFWTQLTQQFFRTDSKGSSSI